MTKATHNPDSTAGAGQDRDRFAIIRKHIKKYKGYLVIGGFSITLAAVFNVYRPYVIKILLDDLEAGTLENHGLKLAGFFVLLTALGGLFVFVNRRTVIWMSRKLEYDIRGELFERLLRMPMSFYHERRVGDIMARLTNDVEAVRLMVGPAIMYFANTIVSTILAVGIMFYMAPELTLYIIIPMPIISFLVTKVGGQIHRRFQAIQAQFSTLTAAAQENLAGIRVIKAYSQEPLQIESFREQGREYVNRNMSLARFNALFHPLLFSTAGMITLIALYFGGREVIAGTITKGTLVSFFVYIAMLIWPIIALGWVVSLYQRGVASLDRINSLLETFAEWESPDEEREESREKVAQINGKIEFRNLSFRYPGPAQNGSKSLALDSINLTVNTGESIGIIGPVASGKSTLASLIVRLYSVQSGQLFIDDRDILDWPLYDLRRQIGFVPQDSFLFSDRLDENIRLGAEGATDSEVEAVSRIASLDGEIAEFKESYGTIVGERGITLSGGQKQRVSIARAALINPKIMILDDATSAVDTATDAKIAGRLRGAMANRTSIIISHRISTVKNCDRIIYLEGGKILELGTHEELLAVDGEYARLNHLQSLQEELSAPENESFQKNV